MKERITDETSFDGVREEWNALLARSDADTPFLTWEWLRTWWRHVGPRRGLNMLLVRSGGRLVAAAPLFNRGWDPRRLRLFRHLSFLGSPLRTGNVGSDYLDFIVDRDAPGAVEELAEAVAAEGRVLELAQVPAEGSACDRLAQPLAAAGWRLEQQAADVCPWIDLSGRTWEAYLAGVGSEHRYAVQRKLRKVHREHDVFFERATTESDRAEALAWLFTLHERRWRDRGESNAFHTPGLRAFHEEFTRLARERDWLRLYLLRLDGEPVSAFYALRYDDTFSFFQSGFDPAFARLSVGLVTMALSIKAAIGEGAARYDMLHGSEEYKFHWANAVRPLVRYQLYPRRPHGALARALTGLYGLVRPMARRVLESS